MTQYRQQLPAYLRKARAGASVDIASHRKVIARPVPQEDAAEARLAAMREEAVIVDAESPLGVKWNAQSARL